MDIMTPTIAEACIKRVITEFSDDTHNIFTPFELCNEILDKIPSLEGDILVVSNLEFVYNLINRGVDNKHIYFTTPCVKKKKMATRWIPEENVFVYENLIKEEDFGDMKFDCVIGNPPYQDIRSKNTHTLWPKFVSTAFNNLCNDNGVVAMITPRTWTTNHTYNTIFTPRTPIAINVDECARYFPGVGSTFSWFVVRNSSPSGSAFVVTTLLGTIELTEWPSTGLGGSAASINILSNLNKHEKFKPFTSYVYHTDRFTKNDSGVSKTQSKCHKIPVLHKRSATGEDTLFFVSINDPKQYNIPRVVFSLWVGRWKDMFVTKDIQTCQQFIQICTTSIAEAKNLQGVLLSNLYRFIMLSTVSGGSLTMKSVSHFPKVDLTRSWTDQELYEHFNLTPEEIQLIEETIK